MWSNTILGRLPVTLATASSNRASTFGALFWAIRFPWAPYVTGVVITQTAEARPRRGRSIGGCSLGGKGTAPSLGIGFGEPARGIGPQPACARTNMALWK